MSGQLQEKSTAGQSAPQTDPTLVRYAIEKLKTEQNLTLGMLGGGAAALIGAGLWAVITVVTGYQIGWMAIGVGVLVASAVRFLGKGIDQVFGLVGSAWPLIGCLLGNLLAVCAVISTQNGLPFQQVLSRLDPNVVKELMVETFSPIDLLFYALALYEGYKLSFRRLAKKDLTRFFPGMS